MLNVLILGGTRFLGKELVTDLLHRGISVTTCSRRVNTVEAVKSLVIERNEISTSTFQEHYDFVIDFTCYDVPSFKIAIENISFSNYILISTSWLYYLENININIIHDITRRYLRGKKDAEIEAEIIKKNTNRNINVLRLPPMLGENDHTKRLDFYTNRMKENLPMYTYHVDNGMGLIQFAWVNDISNILCDFILSNGVFNLNCYNIYDALPTNKISHHEFLLYLKCMLKSESEIIISSLDDIIKNQEGYFFEDPFIKEIEVDINNNNIFKLLGRQSTEIESWLFPLL